MNLNQIHSGEDYSHFTDRGRGENYRRLQFGVQRVKVIRTYSKREWGNQKDTGYVEVFMLDPETGEFRLDSNGQPIIRSVKARHIVGMWEEYWDEHERREVLRKKQEEEWERQREQRRIEREAREAVERAEREEREARERAEREARETAERIVREEREREKREKEEKLLNALKSKYGIERTDGFISVLVTPAMVTVYLDRSKLEHELGLNGGDNLARETTIE